MWAYRLLRKETKKFVPTFKTFFLQNNDITKIFFEKHFLLEGEVYSFPISLGKFIFYVSLLMLFSMVLLNTMNKYAINMCFNRDVCYQATVSANYPLNADAYELPNTSFTYGEITYTKLYKYNVIDSNYEFCKSMVKENPKFKFINKKQMRIHVCFNFCRDGDIYAKNDNRSVCLGNGLDTALMCVMPNEECYYK